MSKKTLNAYVLLDRTGSMATRWDEALSSINTYATDLAKGDVSAAVTVAAFDLHDGFQFDVLRDGQSAKKWKPLTNEDATPRGSTPLLDAIGRIVSMAEEANNKKTVLVVMTDGYENASREMSRDQAKAALDRCKDRKWQVVFLGADFDAFGQSAAVGVAAAQTLNMAKGNYGAAMATLSAATRAYAGSGKDIKFSSDDRSTAGG